MKLITKADRAKAEKNFLERRNSPEINAPKHNPVFKLFAGSACTWLVSEIEPGTNRAFGLCDLGMGEPELGYVDLDELAALRSIPGCERDRRFKASKTLAEYTAEARTAGRIVT